MWVWESRQRKSSRKQGKRKVCISQCQEVFRSVASQPICSIYWLGLAEQQPRPKKEYKWSKAQKQRQNAFGRKCAESQGHWLPISILGLTRNWFNLLGCFQKEWERRGGTGFWNLLPAHLQALLKPSIISCLFLVFNVCMMLQWQEQRRQIPSFAWVRLYIKTLLNKQHSKTRGLGQVNMYCNFLSFVI